MIFLSPLKRCRLLDKAETRCITHAAEQLVCAPQMTGTRERMWQIITKMADTFLPLSSSCVTFTQTRTEIMTVTKELYS